MRSPAHKNIHKKYCTCKVKKKMKPYDKKGTLKYYHEKPSQNIDDLNEIIRVHRSQRGSVKGYWKIKPKDSCEIYKERKRRQEEDEETQNINRSKGSSRVDNSTKNGKRRKRTKKIKKKREVDRRLKKKNVKGKSRKTRYRCCSSSSCITSASTSCTSISGMDYE